MPAATVKRASIPGWYGKIPSVGDFVSRRLPDEFIRLWDDWLQGGMACVRAELGTDWLPRYLVAPVRRFWLAPGLMSAPGWVGVLMPSIDGVGRYFPLTIAAAVTPVEHSLAAALAARDWYRSVDATARKVLDVQFGIDDLEDELARLTPWRADRPSNVEAFHLAEAALDANGGRARSVWWCGDASPTTALGCYASLPPISAFGLLLMESA